MPIACVLKRERFKLKGKGFRLKQNDFEMMLCCLKFLPVPHSSLGFILNHR